MKLSGRDLLSRFNNVLTSYRGNQNCEVDFVSPSENIQSNSLAFLGNSKDFSQLFAIHSSIIVLDQKLKPALELSSDKIPSSNCLILTSSVREALTVILPLFDPRQKRLKQGVHPAAHVEPSAKIDSTAWIGPGAIVGENAQIGARVQVNANSVVEAGAQIGDDSVIEPLVVIGYNCLIGKRCHIFSNTNIGGDGFGFFTNKNGEHKKIPQIGRVVIEDDCEIGSNCAVDRATIGETRIRKGCKFDNFSHVGHNCDLGEDSLFAAGFMIAGSCRIGSHFTAAGAVVMVDHIHVADNVTVGGRSAVTSSIEQPGFYTGYPLQPWKEGIKTIACLPSLPELRKRVQRLEKEVTSIAEKTMAEKTADQKTT